MNKIEKLEPPVGCRFDGNSILAKVNELIDAHNREEKPTACCEKCKIVWASLSAKPLNCKDCPCHQPASKECKKWDNITCIHCEKKVRDHFPETEEERALPCPHGRMPSGNVDGWKRCPHCLGLNNPITQPVKSEWVDWDHNKLDRYMDSCIGGFTPEQIDHMAWYLGTVSEGRMREKEISEKVQTEVDKEKLESYGESFDDPNFGRKD